MRRTTEQDHDLASHIDHRFIARLGDTLTTGTPVVMDEAVVNTDRSVGTLLGYHVTSTRLADELDDDTITVRLTGEAGQSLGAFLPAGVTESGCGQSVPQMMRSALAAISAWASGAASA